MLTAAIERDPCARYGVDGQRRPRRNGRDKESV
jgi:hypothetical protein